MAPVAGWLWYAVPIAALVSGSPLLGAGIWALYGFARLATLAVFSGRMRADSAAVTAVTAVTESMIKTKDHISPHMKALALAGAALIAIAAAFG